MRVSESESPELLLKGSLEVSMWSWLWDIASKPSLGGDGIPTWNNLLGATIGLDCWVWVSTDIDELVGITVSGPVDCWFTTLGCTVVVYNNPSSLASFSSCACCRLKATL